MALAACFGLALAPRPGMAQQAPAPPEGWNFSLAPYVWFSGLSGSVSAPSGSTSVSADFGDIFSSMKFSAMALFEARRDRFSLVVDTLYLNLQQGVPVPGHGAYSGGSVRTQSFEVSAIGLYTLLERPAGRIEVGGGLRGWWFNTDLRLDAGLLPARSGEATTSWVDPVISARGVVRLNDALAMTAYGDVGGFGVGSQLTWQVFATLDWQVTPRLTASAGVRWIHIEYEKGRSTINLDMTGPIVGASYRF
jgi:hypothetical protein